MNHSREHADREAKPLVSVIDDDESVREAVAGLIRWLGVRVNTFSSAIEFLGSPALPDSSCIIADVQMPRMTGIELHGRLRALGYDVPTILITAYPDEQARARALADGIICYLRKPFATDALIGCVRSVLQSGSRPD